MCGRYSLATPDHQAIRARFPVGGSVEIRRRFNVAPTDEVLTVTTDRQGAPRGELLRWGLVPGWAKSPAIGAKMINARVETAAEKPAFRRAFERYRCLIIADGFYEWRRGAGGARQPFHITRDDHDPFAFAGLWSIWHADDERTLRTCTILTTGANSAIESLHDRMPVILTPGHEEEWLDLDTPRERLDEILAGLPARHTELVEVGRAVNNVRNDGPECLEPPDAEPSAPPPAAEPPAAPSEEQQALF
jgi:putative SOS response-associated peptidase YedK